MYVTGRRGRGRPQKVYKLIRARELQSAATKVQLTTALDRTRSMRQSADSWSWTARDIHWRRTSYV